MRFFDEEKIVIHTLNTLTMKSSNIKKITSFSEKEVVFDNGVKYELFEDLSDILNKFGEYYDGKYVFIDHDGAIHYIEKDLSFTSYKENVLNKSITVRSHNVNNENFDEVFIVDVNGEIIDNEGFVLWNIKDLSETVGL